MTRLVYPAVMLFLAGNPAFGFRISKADFPKFAGTLDCKWEGEACPGAAGGFALKGKVGLEIPDPTAMESGAGGKVMLGFPEGKPFSWARYAVDFPSPRTRWVILKGEGSDAGVTLQDFRLFRLLPPDKI